MIYNKTTWPRPSAILLALGYRTYSNFEPCMCMSVCRFLVSIVNLTFAFSHTCIHVAKKVACYKSLYIINLLLSFFNRGESTQHEEPFRAWFSKIGELR
jgi:hypothetical protein